MLLTVRLLARSSLGKPARTSFRDELPRQQAQTELRDVGAGAAIATSATPFTTTAGNRTPAVLIHLGAADHLAGGPQKEIFEDELPITTNKWCAAGAACYLAIISLRPCLAFDDLIKRTTIRALELDCPEHRARLTAGTDYFTGKRLSCRRAVKGPPQRSASIFSRLDFPAKAQTAM